MQWKVARRRGNDVNCVRAFTRKNNDLVYVGCVDKPSLLHSFNQMDDDIQNYLKSLHIHSFSVLADALSVSSLAAVFAHFTQPNLLGAQMPQAFSS